MSINTLRGQSNVYPNGEHEVFLNVIASFTNPTPLNANITLPLVGDTLNVPLNGKVPPTVTLIVVLPSKELFLRLSSRICDAAIPVQISNNNSSFLII